MFRNNILPILSACSVGIGAYLGAKYERLKHRDPRQKVDLGSLLPFDVHASSSVIKSGPPGGSPLSSNASTIMKYGFPSLDNVRTFEDFVLAYDRRTRNPHWVFEHLTPDKLPHNKEANVDRGRSNFFEDTVIHEKFRSLLKVWKISSICRSTHYSYILYSLKIGYTVCVFVTQAKVCL